MTDEEAEKLANKLRSHSWTTAGDVEDIAEGVAWLIRCELERRKAWK